ncbi:MAG: O-antigen ligase family protein [Proteobacteria bacterium]|nr:O-antigen ligase family protein [Pseudomonadota bacterium]
MATETYSPSLAPARPGIETRIAEAGFVLLLLLVIVGLTPFDDRTPAALNARAAASEGGDALRQLAYVGVFAMIVFGAMRIRGLAMLRAMPLMLAVLMIWCLMTSIWSTEPDVVARRAMLSIIFVSSVMLSIDTLGVRRTFELWYGVLAAVIVADWISVALIHNAIHLPSDVESELAGSWRGVHAHKNSAGAAVATASIIFFFKALETRQRRDILLTVAAIGFLIMTRSKSSIGLLPIGLAAGFVYRAARRNALDRAIAATVTALFLLFLGVAIAINWEMIARIFDDPQQFTGRAAIWQAEFAYIRDHPLIGAGFGSFGNTGVRSPLYQYVGADWVAHIGEGHNGYLEMLVTVGGIGLFIGLIVLVVQPFIQFWSAKRTDVAFNAMLFALFTFDLMHNFMESDFVNVTSGQWGQLLLIVGFLRVQGREADEGRVRRVWRT